MKYERKCRPETKPNKYLRCLINLIKHKNYFLQINSIIT